MNEYYKQAKDTFLAYVYASIAWDFISDYMINHKAFSIVDFCVWTYNYGDIVYLSHEAYLEKNNKLLKKAREAFSDHKISYNEAQRIVDGASIKNKDIVIKINDSLLEDLEKLHKEPWKNITLLPAIDTSKAKSHKTTYVHYEKEDKNQFTTISINSTIDRDSYRTDPAKKILSRLLIKVIDTVLCSYLRQHFVFYIEDTNEKTTCRNFTIKTQLAFRKSNAPGKEELQKLCNDFLKSLIEDKNKEYSDFIINTKELLKEAYKDPDSCYLSISSMYSLTNGFIMGYEGWKSVADEKIIKDLLLHSSVELELIN